MIVKIEEAYKLECVDTYSSGKDNTFKCIADGCMAWKWVLKERKIGCCGKAYPHYNGELNIKKEGI